MTIGLDEGGLGFVPVVNEFSNGHDLHLGLEFKSKRKLVLSTEFDYNNREARMSTQSSLPGPRRARVSKESLWVQIAPRK